MTARYHLIYCDISTMCALYDVSIHTHVYLLIIETDTWERAILGSNDELGPLARSGHSAVALHSRLYVWGGRDGYKKINDEQICFKDLWCLETGQSQ